MKKIRILAALMALLLCVSMLLTACGNKDKNPETDAPDATDAGDAAEGEGEGEDKEDTKDPADTDKPAEEKPAEVKPLPTVKLADIMNKNWTLEKAETLTKIEEVKYEGNYETVCSGRFLVTTQDPEVEGVADPNKMITRIYDMNDFTKVVTLNNNLETKDGATVTTENYVFSFNAKYFNVLTVKCTEVSGDPVLKRNVTFTNLQNGTLVVRSLPEFDKDAEGTEAEKSYTEYSLTVYGVNGAEVKKVTAAEIEKLCMNDAEKPVPVLERLDEAYKIVTKPYVIESGVAYEDTDLYTIGSAVYRTVKGADPVKVKDFGIAKMPSTLTQVGENYYEDYAGVFTAYDKNLTVMFKYTLPTYAHANVKKLLANGNLLVQYTVLLDEEVADYDYMSGTQKYDLVTLIVNKDGTTELKDVNYKISDATPSVAVDGQKMYADTVENLVIIYPIVNKLLDESLTNIKIATFSNDGKTVNEVVADEKIIGYPVAVSDDCFGVAVFDGNYAIYNEAGELQGKTNASSYFAGKYVIVEGKAIYDFKGAVVYDLKANNANLTANIGKAKLFTTTDDYGVISRCLFGADGKVTKIENYKNYSILHGYYETETKKTVEGLEISVYTYYNEAGTVIYTFEKNRPNFINSYTFEGFKIVRKSIDNTIYKLTYTK